MAERRSEGRKPTQYNVRITVAGVGLYCSIRNLSLSGCMVECRDLLAKVGSPVELALLPGYVVQGQVAWQVGESLGIFFLKPISAQVVRHYALDDWMLRSDWSLGTWDLLRR
ncbi:MAG: PilZ domain-containing protein [Erythrobacter sp.]